MLKLDAKFYGEIRKVKDGSIVPPEECACDRRGSPSRTPRRTRRPGQARRPAAVPGAVTVRLEGTDKLQAALGRCSKKMAEALQDALQQAADEMLTEALRDMELQSFRYRMSLLRDRAMTFAEFESRCVARLPGFSVTEDALAAESAGLLAFYALLHALNAVNAR